MATLRLDALAVVPGVSEVTARVPAGALVAVMATPSVGTALARVVAGLAPARSGRILVGDRDVTDLPPARRQIGYVPAGGTLLPHLTVRRNIEYGQRRRERVHAMADDWIGTVIERLELAPTLGMLPHLLSDAHRFRVALARAAASLPEVIVIDLPDAADGTVRLDDLLPRLTPPASPGIATLVCSADPAVVDLADDRVSISSGPAPVPRTAADVPDPTGGTSR